ncbi:MAG: hypothetical protein D6756_14375, partial [Cyanobacteria bacterium J083]
MLENKKSLVEPTPPKKNPLIRLGLLLTVLGSLGILTIKGYGKLELGGKNPLKPLPDEQSLVLPLVALPPTVRQAQLNVIAQAEKSSLDRSRARYLLALDLIQQQAGKEALQQLKGLEKEYKLLAPYILIQRAKAFQLASLAQQAQNIWQKVIEEYPDSPVVAEALYALGKNNSSYWESMLEKFPNHPHSHEITRQRLAANPNQFELLLLLAKYSREDDIDNIRNRLVLEYPSQLSPTDWQAIADGYWQDFEYRKAADAYALAPVTPQNLYRAARGLHLNGNKKAAIRAYDRLISDFPDARETATGLLHLSTLSSRQQALRYLDQVIEDFPTQAPAAILAKIAIYEVSKRPDLVTANGKVLLKKYPKSTATAQYRWQIAHKNAQAGNLSAAWRWVSPLIKQDLNSDIAAKAAFFAGKWAKELGKIGEAEKCFKYVLARYPYSYYAWRSAVRLGWQVGDFTTLRQNMPEIQLPSRVFIPPAGSETFKELYKLEQIEDAHNLLQAEIGNRQELTVAEQFTDGLLLQKEGKIRESIWRIWSLSRREDPKSVKSWQKLRKTPEYWYSLFPFPHQAEIIKYSRQHQINPMLVISVIRQESRFDPKISSPVGATGLMQLIPSTAQWVAKKIELKDYSLTDPDNNINLGSWY